MLVLEYKVKAKNSQYQAIEEAIKTTQFVRNRALRYWLDAPRELKIARLLSPLDSLLHPKRVLFNLDYN